MSVKYAVVFEHAPLNWSAWVPDLPGCMSTGKTIEEVRSNIREAIEGHLQTMRIFGEEIPAPSSKTEEIEVLTAA